jgi:hypothetical protein
MSRSGWCGRGAACGERRASGTAQRIVVRVTLVKCAPGPLDPLQRSTAWKCSVRPTSVGRSAASFAVRVRRPGRLRTHRRSDGAGQTRRRTATRSDTADSGHHPRPVAGTIPLGRAIGRPAPAQCTGAPSPVPRTDGRAGAAHPSLPWQRQPARSGLHRRRGRAEALTDIIPRGRADRRSTSRAAANRHRLVRRPPPAQNPFCSSVRAVARSTAG